MLPPRRNQNGRRGGRSATPTDDTGFARVASLTFEVTDKGRGSDASALFLSGFGAYIRVMATSSQRLLTADEFLRIDFGPDLKAELDNGVIRMMAGSTRLHDRVQVNLIIALGTRLRGSGCRPSGSDMALRTHGSSIRYPDVSIYCGSDAPDDDGRKALNDPRVLIEILSPSTEADDSGPKLREYKALSSVELIALIDPESERLHVFQRTAHHPESWSEVIHVEPADLDLPTLGITIPHGEIFARD